MWIIPYIIFIALAEVGCFAFVESMPFLTFCLFGIAIAWVYRLLKPLWNKEKDSDEDLIYGEKSSSE